MIIKLFFKKLKINFIYLECWKYEPNERPNMQKIVLILKSIISPDNVNDSNLSYVLENDESISISSKGTDLNRSLSIGSHIYNKSESNKSSQNIKSDISRVYNKEYTTANTLKNDE